MYLDPATEYDKKKNLHYVPIKINDDMGGSFIYYLGVEFNKKLLSPVDWPNKYNWPDFTNFK